MQTSALCSWEYAQKMHPWIQWHCEKDKRLPFVVGHRLCNRHSHSNSQNRAKLWKTWLMHILMLLFLIRCWALKMMKTMMRRCEAAEDRVRGGVIRFVASVSAEVCVSAACTPFTSVRWEQLCGAQVVPKTNVVINNIYDGSVAFVRVL